MTRFIASLSFVAVLTAAFAPAVYTYATLA